MNAPRCVRIGCLFLFLGVLWAGSAAAQRIPIDQVPMYGGMDRSAVPELKEADERFIGEVTGRFGSREKASTLWVEQGFLFYQQDKLDMAMRRFNQAWLLNPANPEVYSGFAVVQSDQGNYCEAQKLIDIGLSKGPLQDGFLPDAALIYTVCAVESRAMDAPAKQASFRKADDLLARALSSPVAPRSYTLTQWAKVLFVRGDFEGAWTKAAEHRKETGREMDSGFLKQLRARMPEPKS